MNFTAIDFETATWERYSACAVGIITVEDDKIIDEYDSLIQPPDNEYSYYNTNVHGITENDTFNALFFPDIYPEIKKRLQGKTIVAHNESFDRSVLQKTMEYYDLDYSELNILNPWKCTLKIYRAKGYKPATLDICCKRQGIKLNHHEALSDARGCAMLYLKSDV
ncbi:3'-5' exonuclease [Desulfobacula sp.]|uniref:3'-5' exonuclease n=1 Tax=Desulfobacula sp. TaxID=2593537 RepID=UPI0026129C82|nr:3'-5' exonuclease [Desulfobacula sp.]